MRVPKERKQNLDRDDYQMVHLKLQNIVLAGFAAEKAEPGQEFKLLVKSSATSNELAFYLYAEPIASAILTPVGLQKDTVDRFLAVIHPDNTGDLYVNNFPMTLRVKVNKTIQAGELVYSNNIDDIEKVEFPDIRIDGTDRVVFFDRTGWRFGIFFDLSGTLDLEKLLKDIAGLKKRLLLENILEIVRAELEETQGYYDALVITEGKTDWRHLERAFREIEYLLPIHFDVSDQDRGAKDLLHICKALSLEPKSKPVICIFDRDNAEITAELLKKTGGAETPYQDWGNKVFSMLLPIPPGREKYENISIEFYYSDAFLRVPDADGKRLLFSNEVHIEVLADRRVQRVLTDADPDKETRKKVYAKDVDSIFDADGKNVAISKSVFADRIYKGIWATRPDFSSFYVVAKVIDQILSDLNKK